MSPGLLLLAVALGGAVRGQSLPTDSLREFERDSLAPLPAKGGKRVVSRYNVVKINPFSLLAGQLSLFYERSLTPTIACTLGYGMGGNRTNFGRQLEPGGAIYQRGTLELRRYWSGRRLIGFYTGPYLRLSRLTSSQFVYDSGGNAIRNSAGVRLTTNQRTFIWIPGVMAGGQASIRRFYFDAFLGLQRQLATGRLEGNQFVEAMTAPWALRFGLCAGVAF